VIGFREKTMEKEAMGSVLLLAHAIFAGGSQVARRSTAALA